MEDLIQLSKKPEIIKNHQKQPPEVFCKKKMFLEISHNSQENTCPRVSFLIKLQAPPKKETLAQLFSCEICEITKNTFFTEYLWWLLLCSVGIELVTSTKLAYQVQSTSSWSYMAIFRFASPGIEKRKIWYTLFDRYVF